MFKIALKWAWQFSLSEILLMASLNQLEKRRKVTRK
jgi:hypothetical protein